MNEMRGSNPIEQDSLLDAVEQIRMVPVNASIGGAGAARRDRVHLIPAPQQPGERMAADEACRAGQQHTLHAVKSGNAQSRAEITRCSAYGHSIANAGSSQRTPPAAAGSKGTEMWYSSSASSTSV